MMILRPCLTFAILVLFPLSHAQPGSAIIWQGMYTQAQAERGLAAYSESCTSCHAADLRGNSNSPSLLGMSFMFLWEGKSVGELYEQVRSNMPVDRPGALGNQTYADIIAYMLQANGFPTGETELGTDPEQLNLIAIVPKPAP